MSKAPECSLSLSATFLTSSSSHFQASFPLYLLVFITARHGAGNTHCSVFSDAMCCVKGREGGRKRCPPPPPSLPPAPPYHSSFTLLCTLISLNSNFSGRPRSSPPRPTDDSGAAAAAAEATCVARYSDATTCNPIQCEIV